MAKKREINMSEKERPPKFLIDLTQTMVTGFDIIVAENDCLEKVDYIFVLRSSGHVLACTNFIPNNLVNELESLLEKAKIAAAEKTH